MPEKSLIEVAWNNVWKWNKKRKEDVLSFCRERGRKKKILSPHEESNLRPSDFRAPMLYRWATKIPWWARLITNALVCVFARENYFPNLKQLLTFVLFFLFQINCFILVSVIYVLLRKTMVKAGKETSARKSSIRYIKRNNLELTAWTIYLVKVAASL